MENRYPLFAGGRILKKESLWDLRDYAFKSLQLQYSDYTDGIIRGCEIRVEGNKLVIGRGMLKHQDFIYLIENEESIPFVAENRTIVLKAAFDVMDNHMDYHAYHINFFIDYELDRQENQIELCRFHLREGSSLRDRYQDFRDLRTEYDTVNLVDSSISGNGLMGIHPIIINKYIEQLGEMKDIVDFGFAAIAMQNGGWINRKTLALYLANKMPHTSCQEICEWNNNLIVDKLEAILSNQYESGNNSNKKIIYVE